MADALDGIPVGTPITILSKHFGPWGGPPMPTVADPVTTTSPLGATVDLAPVDSFTWAFPLGAKVQVLLPQRPDWCAAPWRIIARVCREEPGFPPFQTYHLALVVTVEDATTHCSRIYGIAASELAFWKEA